MDTDPVRRTGEQPPSPPPAAGVSRHQVMRGVLWLGLVLGTVGNLVASFWNAGLPVQLAFGAVIAYCLLALAIPYLWRRR